MKTVIIFDHPYTATAGDNVPHHRSFLAALLKTVMAQQRQANHDVDLIDLHADGFNPVMSADDLSNWRRGQSTDPMVADYQRRLLTADRIIFMFPVWWEVMPAMTKGFLDKVYAKGQLYQADTMQTKLTKQPRIDIITTMSTPNWIYRLIFGAPLAKLLFRGTFLKTRLWHFKWHNFAQVEKKTPAQREAILHNFTL
ncbi:NAD(P)H-dependent oxidoreductase [Levilactobacillus huananensis]|uniref:NAD(P)H-dependent oxidoreductase n=1 Tax=Levilactobacillus huananensis TaxID=2486019 RepID=UPI000F77FDBA|nr:NAD(P)H-dependent oxidoreductase [Levilactobacillus huananensis]